MDFALVISYLSAFSSIAVILGAIFVVFQLRQNSKLIELSIRENRSSIAFALLERITDENFALRRKKMHDTIRKYKEMNWEGFDDSLEDFEARNFAYIYELIGQFARENITDLSTVASALQYLVVTDWNAFRPLSEHLMSRFNLKVNPWGSFEWLADETMKRMNTRERTKT